MLYNVTNWWKISILYLQVECSNPSRLDNNPRPAPAPPPPPLHPRGHLKKKMTQYLENDKKNNHCW